MHLIMLSGGSGQRLWPLSNDVRSKQFLKILYGPRGIKESMVQRVYRQINEVGGWQSVSVVAGISQREQLVSQLGAEVNLITEPCRRDTFPAIALSCAYLYSEKGVGLEESIAVIPVDPYVENEYFERVANIAEVLDSRTADLVLLGAAPLKPSEKYGYIVPIKGSDKSENVQSYKVEYFKEKPTLEDAEDLIKRGALWNCGVFGIKLGYVFDILRDKYGITEFSFKNMEGLFQTLSKTSFDYEVVEKARNIKVIKYQGEWKDLGTWETLTEELKENAMGNVVMDEKCLNTHVINELDLPIITMGLHDSVVVASPDGILVANKGETYRLKELSGIPGKRPMFEERRWGRYIVLEHRKYEGGEEVLTKRLHLDKDKQISYQYHYHRKEVWTIAAGEGILYLDGIKSLVKCGDVVIVEKGMRHGIKGITDMDIMEIQTGEMLVEEDIVRIEYDWE